MAKIYETQEDFEKDKLKEQAADLRLFAANQSWKGATFIGGSFFTDLMRERGSIRGGWTGWLSAGLSTIGIIEIVRSFFTDSKAHTLELERERMGPATTVYPPGALPPGLSFESGGTMPDSALQDTVTMNNGRIVREELQVHHKIEPKTLMEQAEKPCGCPFTRGN